jgi:hypothetical protein
MKLLRRLLFLVLMPLVFVPRELMRGGGWTGSVRLSSWFNLSPQEISARLEPRCIRRNFSLGFLSIC